MTLVSLTAMTLAFTLSWYFDLTIVEAIIVGACLGLISAIIDKHHKERNTNNG